MNTRPYRDEDFDAMVRMWREVGWIDNSDEKKDAMAAFMGAGSSFVAVMDGEVESMAQWMPGSMLYVDTDLSMAAVTAVMTSRVGRKQGFASQLTAEALAESAAAGAALSILGVFDQGFYDRLGYGTGSYESQLTFDPGSLDVDVPYRVPIRLSLDDWEEMHGALTRRMRFHGGAILEPPAVMRGELGWFSDSMFGLGYRTDGRLSHFIAGKANGESGPYDVGFISYENAGQLLELLRLIRELSDQVLTVKMMEPPEIQLQDLIRQPMRQRARSMKSDHETSHRAQAFWQVRIIDLAKCVEARRAHGDDVVFNLSLSDPLDDHSPGAGIGGDYTITIGAASGVETGHGAGLQLLEATVNAFSRMWLGVRPATSLAITDALTADQDLLAALDRAFLLPRPRIGWLF